MKFAMLALLQVSLPLACGDEYTFQSFASFERRPPHRDSVFRFTDNTLPSSSRFEFRDENFGSQDEEWQPESDSAPAGVFVFRSTRSQRGSDYRMPAEFEQQSALMVSGSSLAVSAPEVLEDLVRTTSGYVKLWLLFNDELELDSMDELLKARGAVVPPSFLLVQHNTMWARDYGPTVLKSLSHGSLIVDAGYGDPGRAFDDAVPSSIAQLLRTRARQTKLNLPGGNILTNGQGLLLTTTRVQEENAGMSQTQIVNQMAETFNASSVAVLEPLQGEATGHVDMFATFTDAHTVVLGSYEHHVDPVNAELLDRNAERLARITVGRRTLRVVRIPMPSRRERRWPTFTNVVYANGLLLVPSYESTTEREKQAISSSYSALLPGWDVRFIRCDSLITSGGALHCVVSNLNSLTFGLPLEAKGRDRESQQNSFQTPHRFAQLAY